MEAKIVPKHENLMALEINVSPSHFIIMALCTTYSTQKGPFPEAPERHLWKSNPAGEFFSSLLAVYSGTA